MKDERSCRYFLDHLPLVNSRAGVAARVQYLNKYLSAVLFSHGGAWDITDKEEDGL